jgi:hypothetical protein
MGLKKRIGNVGWTFCMDEPCIQTQALRLERLKVLALQC